MRKHQDLRHSPEEEEDEDVAGDDAAVRSVVGSSRKASFRPKTRTHLLWDLLKAPVGSSSLLLKVMTRTGFISNSLHPPSFMFFNGPSSGPVHWSGPGPSADPWTYMKV